MPTPAQGKTSPVSASPSARMPPRLEGRRGCDERAGRRSAGDSLALARHAAAGAVADAGVGGGDFRATVPRTRLNRGGRCRRRDVDRRAGWGRWLTWCWSGCTNAAPIASTSSVSARNVSADSPLLAAGAGADTPGARHLARRYVACALVLLLFTAAMVVMERSGLRRSWIGSAFLLLPVVLYASIGLACRTTEASQYFVAGRNVPALYNGMAIGADWMSVASFMGLAGLLYANGFGGLAYVLGWTGGFA